MKMIAAISAMMFAATLMSAPAQAKGCLKGAIAGGAVGHYAAHHGWLGAAAGCLIGRHEAAQREREQEKARQQQGASDYQGYRTDYR
jgi:hypothetical protein